MKKKKSLIGWTWNKWWQDFHKENADFPYATSELEEVSFPPVYILKGKERWTEDSYPIKKVRITIEEI